jgi:hypothetical protein
VDGARGVEDGRLYCAVDWRRGVDGMLFRALHRWLFFLARACQEG